MVMALPYVYTALASAAAAKVVDAATKPKAQTLPAPPILPNQDEAANATDMAQADAMRRRRGVLSNIFAGGNASTPTVGTKATLG